ncbi:mycothione reductase [Rothia terrae]|uniref:mycothione reductase n=1 Tax=Rothia terrae TaxID=396015 RepID=UPI00288231F5|nr:mycothione reductase [Rothia terrae]MDT0190293.1 mycothione reductase [Rothia terrae]
MDTQEFDLIIIGSGSGNSLIDGNWDNKKVAIIDGGTFGGTCLNFGCIPTKQYVYPATVAHTAEHIDHLGVKAKVTDVNWSAMRDRIFARIDAISNGGLDYRKGLNNVTVFEEYAHFVDTHTLETDSGARLSAPQIVLATGSRSVLPDVPGIDSSLVHTSDTVMRIDALPARVLILGGGFIAAEFAHVFNGLGAEVIQAHRSDVLLRKNDSEISQKFAEQAAKQWDLRLNRSLKEIRENSDGTATVTFKHEGKIEEIETDLILVATGRRPNSDTLAAEKFFDVDEKTALVSVDAAQRVLKDGEPVDGIFALGDVSSMYQLKHVANAEARIVQYNLVHPESMRETDHRYVPAAVFTHPQIAHVGLTEEEAREKAQDEGFELAVKVQNIGDVAYGWAMEDSVGFVKLLANKKTGELLGAHIMGEEASNLIQPIIQAMSFGLSALEMARGQYWIHPALSEVIENALLGLETEK